MNAPIPISVLVMTRNEAPRIGHCLAALKGFDEIVVVDSASSDETLALARASRARTESFVWNGQYPKKRQWCLDNLTLKHDWVFLVDADEEVTPALTAEIRVLFESGKLVAGYFVQGLYVREGQVLRFGLHNSKLVLFDRRRVEFPVVDDAGFPGMGEIEGHYQPVLKPSFGKDTIGRLRQPLLHHAYDDPAGWEARHRRYATWEAAMNAHNAWPTDPVPARQALKRLFRRLPARGAIAFAHSYILKCGFLDGRAGFMLARDRWRYYAMIAKSAAAP